MATHARLRSRLYTFAFIAILSFLITQSEPTQAEYRIYKIGVKYNEKQKKELEILTTLDDQQYVTYYRQTASQQTRLIDHWMCRGRTDEFKKYCAKAVPKKITQNTVNPQAPNPAQGQGQPQTQPPAQQVPPPNIPVVIQ
jgi:hypothetical protein